MASVPNDKDWYTYLHPADGHTYNMLVAKWWASQTGSGFTVSDFTHPTFVASKRNVAAGIIAQDVTTSKRKIRLPIGNQTATLNVKNATFSWLPRGSAAPVTMTVIKLTPAKAPAASSTTAHTVYP